MQKIMTSLKLTVNEKKTRIACVPEESFDFLGYTIGQCYSVRTRRAIVDADGLPLLVLHYSIFNDYIVSQLEKQAETDPAKLTFGNLVDANDWLLTESFVTVNPSASGAKAKEAVELYSRCKDVFVTTTGTPKGAVIRWITNVHLLEAANV